MRCRLAMGVLVVTAAATVLAGCGAAPGCAGASCAPSSGAENLSVQPQNTTLVVGVNRISVALLDPGKNPVAATGVTVDILGPGNAKLATRPLDNIAAVYGGIPIYVGTAQFPAPGQYDFLVRGTAASGGAVGGHAFVTVSAKGPELAVGAAAPAVHQAVLTDPGVTISAVDSGVPPDIWHDRTVAQALAAHQPMVLFFGQPGYCPSKTCGPTVSILQQLCTQYCSRFSFQHIETDYPASAAQVFNNPAFRAFGLQSDPWVYFVNAAGLVTDRFEGPVTIAQLQGAAEGTLAGRVPAVTLAG
jgi:hypothetical protein